MPSRMRHVPAFTHAYDFKAREEYMYNHELNPQRYKLPKPRDAPPDRSAGAEYWTQGVTQQDVSAFEAARHGPTASAARAPGVRNTTRKTKRKARKTVRFASERSPAPAARRLILEARGAPARATSREAEEDEREEQVEEEEEDAPPFSLAAQVREDLSGIWADLQAFDRLPAHTTAGKLRCMMMRGNRALSVLGVLGVILLAACIVGAFAYFRRPAAGLGAFRQPPGQPAGQLAGQLAGPSMLLGGAMPAYEDEWTRTFAPRTPAGTWMHHLH